MDEVKQSWPVRIYAALLTLLLPDSFWGAVSRDQLIDLFSRLYGEGRERRGWRGGARALRREIASLVRIALEERRLQRRRFEAVLGRRERSTMIDSIVQDARQALRVWTQRPFSALAAIAMIALGIGASTAVFSLSQAILVDTVAIEDPDRVLVLMSADREGNPRLLSYEDFRDWQQENEVFERIAALLDQSVNVTGGERPERIRGLFVSSSFFSLIGVEPALGRGLAAGEDEPGGRRAAVLSHGFWQRRWGGDADILGQSVKLNNESHVIVGVMPADHRPIWDQTEAWISWQTVPRSLDRYTGSAMGIARLKPGVSQEQAQLHMGQLAARLAQAYPDSVINRSRIHLSPLRERFLRWQRPVMLVLMAGAAMVLLIACANVANLQLTLAGGRRRELAIRAALGGSKLRLMRQILSESLILSLVGGVIGVVLAHWSVKGVLALRPYYRDFFDVSIDLQALTFCLAATIATGVLFGLAPALLASRSNPAFWLSAGGRGQSWRPAGRRTRNSLAVVQFALALVLLIGAGLLLRSAHQMSRVDTGFDPQRLLTLEYRLPGNKYDEPAKILDFHRRTLAEISGLPGVRGVAAAGALPFSGNGGSLPLIPEGSGLEAADAPRIGANIVSPGYFRLMGIPILQGRALDDRDRSGSKISAVISRRTAEAVWPDEDPLGKRFRMADMSAEVVGVAGDVHLSLTQEAESHVYLSLAQAPSRFASLAVRTSGDPMSMAPSVQKAIWRIDPDQPVWEIMPITQRIADSVASRRFTLSVLSAFALAALLLAAVGIYAVMAFSVSQRTREIGVRMALGAERRGILSWMVAQGMRLLAVGAVAGLAAASALTHALSSMLFGVAPLDPITFSATPLALALVALVACVLPAWRASRIDPATTLQRP